MRNSPGMERVNTLSPGRSIPLDQVCLVQVSASTRVCTTSRATPGTLAALSSAVVRTCRMDTTPVSRGQLVPSSAYSSSSSSSGAALNNSDNSDDAGSDDCHEGDGDHDEGDSDDNKNDKATSEKLAAIRSAARTGVQNRYYSSVNQSVQRQQQQHHDNNSSNKKDNEEVR